MNKILTIIIPTYNMERTGDRSLSHRLLFRGHLLNDLVLFIRRVFAQ